MNEIIDFVTDWFDDLSVFSRTFIVVVLLIFTAIIGLTFIAFIVIAPKITLSLFFGSAILITGISMYRFHRRRKNELY